MRSFWCLRCVIFCQLPESRPRRVVIWGYFGSILFSVFLIGWGCAFLWGPLADRFGRVRALMLAILVYSLFTFLGCMAQSLWQLGVCRLIAGFGVGGEFVGAAILVAEEMPDRLRVRGACFLNRATTWAHFSRPL